ncbi:oxidoreductase [Paenibacillus sp. LC231]|uniref:flavin-containing monooxygenase n=1 Tax=Paenibacillus sp. LC231 TaxID=1120679 RepID=UPI0008DC7921|nr:NAD(P)/FAD-dependent oxidoreductase [Paenibacillus sp. LC231]OIB00568.1 oxidoreductase [Paenibacillus sp. LC231]
MLDTIVIGGGQAGLAAAYYLKQNSVNFLILDGHREVGDSWRDRYDSLHLFTPRMYNSLPGAPFQGDPQGLPHKNEVADYLKNYAKRLELPVQSNTQVTSLTMNNGIFEVSTTKGTFRSKKVIVATGPFQKPLVPSFHDKLGDAVIQLHSSEYRNKNHLKEGGVLVVGAGNSGAQIASELADDFDVHLSASGEIQYKPLHIFGKSIFWYFDKVGFLTANRKSTLGKWLHAMPEQIYGKELKLLIQQGRIQLHARTEKIVDQTVYFQNEESPIHIDNIIWATGFKRDDHWIDIEAAFKDGHIDHMEGVSVVKGLYFVGLPWQTSRGSALLGWVKYDAKRIVDYLLRE